MLQTIGPNTDPSIVLMILADIAELKRMPDLAYRLRTYTPQPDPIQQQLQQLAVLKAQKEIEKLDSEIELNKANAAEAMANRDKKNLDFVEQETGTAHAREIAKQKAQSEGNQNLQITKALTSPIKEGDKSPNIEAAIGFNQLSDKLNESQTNSTIG